jgi:hypothetical protein
VADGRRLAAITFTDTVGCTASTPADEGRGRAQVLAVIYAYLVDAERCGPWLERALARRESSVEWWRSAPRLESVRSDPRVAGVIARSDAS